MTGRPGDAGNTVSPVRVATLGRAVPPGAGPSRLSIETRGLSKRFGRQLAVDGVDLAVPRGSVFGFLGPNGSGKTTTIRILLGLAAASAGTVHVLGEEMPRQLRSVLPRVGALVEGPAFYPFLSGTANMLRFDAADPEAPARTRHARVHRALERVGLTHAADKPVKAYSLGMKQRLGIANALLAPRELLVLDEPTNGLDPQGTREVRNLVRSLAADGTTVFVSSHLLAEVEQICTHAAIMSAGRVVAQGTLAQLRQDGHARVRVLTPNADDAVRVLRGLGLAAAAGQGGEVTAPLPEDPAAAPQLPPEDLVSALVAAGVRVRGFAVEQGSLEDRFVELTGEGFDVAR